MKGLDRGPIEVAKLLYDASTGGCQGGGRSLARDHAILPRAGGADLDAASAVDPGPTRYAPAEGLPRGAYVLADADHGKLDVLLPATRSKVWPCIESYEELTVEGIRARVVSMPLWELFEHYCRHHPDYREQVLPDSVTARVSMEPVAMLGWARDVGRHGHSIGMETFGASHRPVTAAMP